MQTLILVLLASNLLLIGAVIYSIFSTKKSIKVVDSDIFSLLHVTQSLLIYCGLLDENGKYIHKKTNQADKNRDQPLP